MSVTQIVLVAVLFATGLCLAATVGRVCSADVQRVERERTRARIFGHFRAVGIPAEHRERVLEGLTVAVREGHRGDAARVRAAEYLAERYPGVDWWHLLQRLGPVLLLVLKLVILLL